MVKMPEKPEKKQEDMDEKYEPQFVVDETGKKNMVLLKLDVYENLLETLSDLSDIEARKHDPVITNEEMKLLLEKDGKI